MNHAILQMLPVLMDGRAGKVLHAFGDQVTVKLGGEDTAGAFALCEFISQPGGGPPLHCHLNEDELFIVQEGQVSFFIEGKWTEIEVGGIAFAPRGLTHSFKNTGETPSRMWVMTTPAGFEKFFARCSQECANPGGPNMDRIVEISADHGIFFVDPPPAAASEA